MLKFVSNGLRMTRVFQAVAAFLVLSTAAYADCASLQKGNEIFADSFADNTGGWPTDPDASLGKTGLTLKLYAPNSSWVYLNNTFNATDGDYCVEGTLPSSPAANNLAYIGLAFLAKDANTFVVFQVDSSGGIQLYRKVSGNWTQISNLSRPSLAPKPGSVVTLRAVVKGSLISVSLNGVDLQKVRVQVPTTPLQFGVYIQTDNNVPKPGVSFEFSKYRVTAGE
ncbi:MAG: hypothetical protein P4L68_01435 [Methylovirgula sp.]|nr:hypothetical protein [Methylovirgula sp.]